MKVLLHDPEAGLYFRSLHEWTHEPAEALDLENVDEAMELARGTGCRHCELILTWEGSAALLISRRQAGRSD